MTSTAVLTDRKPNGGTVRITSPSYPPSADLQGKATELAGQVCSGRAWEFAEWSIAEERHVIPKDETNGNWVWYAGYGTYSASRAIPLKPDQVVELNSFAKATEAPRPFDAWSAVPIEEVSH
ncbi:MAG: hypothetical protein WB493_03575 [Anaeromyxobacteraceae bacterium]